MLEVTIKTGKAYMDVAMIHRFLTEDSYWARGISFDTVDRSLTHSCCVGAFLNDKQVGFVRIVTDYHTFGWVADFFVLPAYRGQGVSKKMLTYITEQPWFRRLRRKMLNTSDAHGLYRQFQFEDLADPSNILEIYCPDAHLAFNDE